MNPHKVMAIRALNEMRSDEAARAGWALRKLSEERLKEKPPGGVLTYQQLLNYYDGLDDPINKAIAWVEAQPD